jgi:septal ring factor EnvC (AmiA/AmiB activator)
MYSSFNLTRHTFRLLIFSVFFRFKYFSSVLIPPFLAAHVYSHIKLKNESISSEADVLEQENAELERELNELEQETAPIITTTHTHAQFVSDAKRFTEYIQSLDEQIVKQRVVLKDKMSHLQQCNIQLEAAIQEKLRLAVSWTKNYEDVFFILVVRRHRELDIFFYLMS